MNLKQIYIVLFVAISCKKAPTGTTPTALSTQDNENYVIVDGVTHYHYIYAPMASSGCQNDLYYWMNHDKDQPDVGCQIQFYNKWAGLPSVAIIQINGELKPYTAQIKNPLPVKVVNGLNTVEFKDLKMYEGFSADTTAPSKLVSGKFTCNGK